MEEYYTYNWTCKCGVSQTDYIDPVFGPFWETLCEACAAPHTIEDPAVERIGEARE